MKTQKCILVMGVIAMLLVLSACQPAPTAVVTQAPAPTQQVVYPEPGSQPQAMPAYPGVYPEGGDPSGKLIEWIEAETYLLSGQVSSVVQTHSLDVTL
ncbi:MAG: hypothetical protein EHM70_25560, partial [Chloroflexota bacterium]